MLLNSKYKSNPKGIDGMMKITTSSSFSIGAEETEPIKPTKVKRDKKPIRRLCGSCSYDAVFGFGLVPSSFTITAVGGTGKTTWLLQHQQEIINQHKRLYRSERIPKCLFVTNEMTIEALSAMCARLNVKNVDIAHIVHLEKILPYFEKYDYVIVDSLQGVRVQGVSKSAEAEEAVKQIVAKQQATNCSVGIIRHLTKDGKAKGNSSIGHIVDCNLSLHKGSNAYFGEDTIVVNVEKNRNGPSGFVPFHITSSGFEAHYIYTVGAFAENYIVSELPKKALKG